MSPQVLTSQFSRLLNGDAKPYSPYLPSILLNLSWAFPTWDFRRFMNLVKITCDVVGAFCG